MPRIVSVFLEHAVPILNRNFTVAGIFLFPVARGLKPLVVSGRTKNRIFNQPPSLHLLAKEIFSFAEAERKLERNV